MQMFPHIRPHSWPAIIARHSSLKPGVLSACLAVSAAAALAGPQLAHAQQPSGGASSPAPDPALRDYLSANGLLSRGMNELAAGEYRKFLEKYPQHDRAAVARYGLGVALFRMKKFDEAAKELSPLIDQAPDDFEFTAETLLIVGQSEFEMKNWQRAVDPLARLASDYARHDAADDAAGMAVEANYRLERHEPIDGLWSRFGEMWPDSPMRDRVDYLRGLSLVARQKDSDAAEHLAKFLERAPESEFADRATLLRAQCLHRQGDLKTAATEYRSLLDREDALGADATYGMAVLSQQNGEPVQASQHYDHFLDRWPDHASSPAAKIDRGRLCVTQENYDRARTLLQEGGAGFPERADEAEYWLAKCDLRQDQFAEAATRLRNAIEQFPESPLVAEMKYDRGVALARAEDVSGAIAALDDFRTKFGDHELEPDATALQATLEHQRGAYDASAKLCEAFLLEHADHPQAAAMLFLAAEDDMLRERFEDAASKYQAFLNQYPSDGSAKTAMYRLGSAQFRLERYADAQPTLATVVEGRQTDKAYRRALLMLGDIAFQNQQWDDAIELLGDYLSFGNDQPSADDAMLKLGLAHVRSERSSQAIEHFTALLTHFDESPHRVQAIFERGQARLAQDDLDEAKQDFAEVEKAGDTRFRSFAINHLATIAMRQQDWASAEKLYAELEQTGGSDDATSVVAEAPYRRGQALMASKEYAAAAEAFADALERDPSPQRVAAIVAQQSIALSRSGEHEAALKAIESLSSLNTQEVPPDVLAAVAYEKAWCLRETSRVEDAMQAYRDLLKTYEADANAPHAMLELAELESSAGNHAAAAEWLQRLDTIASQDTNSIDAVVRERGLYRLAVAEFELKQYADSARHAEAFIASFPESELIPSARLFAGESQFKEAAWSAAADHFAAIIDKHVEDTGCATAMLRLGECHAQLQRWPESEETFTSFLERFPDHELWFQAQFGVAFARENRALHAQAMEAYRKVIDRHSGPTAARAQFQIGECLFAQKNFTEAVRELLKVDILYGYDEWSAAALYEAGRCFEELGQPDQARAQFAQVKEKYPDTEWARLATQRLAAAPSSTGGG